MNYWLFWGQTLTETVDLRSMDLDFAIAKSVDLDLEKEDLNLSLLRLHFISRMNYEHGTNRPKKKPVLLEIMRACLKVAWLNIFIGFQVFTIILTYNTYVTLTSLTSFESNSIQANRRPLI